jgi:hypothetical protein
MKAIALLLCSFLLFVTACSSSPAASSKADCFTGVFDVTFAAESNGNANCPDLTADATQWIYVVHNGTVSGPEPKGTTPTASNRFDNDTCSASEEFAAATPATGCAFADKYFFTLTFDAKGLAGVYRFIGCGASGDAGAVEALDCSYPVTGTKQQ